MKKIILLAAALCITMSASAFAAEVTPTAADAGKTVKAGAKVIGKLSASVMLGAAYDATGYAITTQHLKGTKTFGTSHDSTAIYSNDTLVADAPGQSDSGAFGTGWTAM